MESKQTQSDSIMKKRNEAATKIQQFYIFQDLVFGMDLLTKKFSNIIRILYSFNFRNPQQLLKVINPSESYLLDAAARVHVRFRLGGQNFPPTIYYKIFGHGAITDVNSFAPRDYQKIQKEKENKHKLTYDQYRVNVQKYQGNGWYIRMDNNGWRPIYHKLFDKPDFVEIYSQNQIKYHHHSKQKRQEKNIKRRKINRMNWLKKLYKPQTEEQNMFISQTPEDLDDETFDQQVEELLDWSESLDYDSYVKYWFQLSTSNASDNFSKSTNSSELTKSIKQ